MRTGRAARGLRGLAVALVATLVALVSHVTAGGAMPGAVGIVVPFAFSLMVCTVLAGRRLALWRISIAVGLSQLLFHALFVLGTFTPSGPAVHGGHHHEPGMPMPAVEPASTALMQSGTSMWFWHGLAAVVTIAAVYRGESLARALAAAALRLLTWVRRAAVRCGGLRGVARIRRILARAAADERAPRIEVVSSLRRRGPPPAFTV
jgi:hypothetical protein